MRNFAFTLIELILVVVIVVILASVAIVRFGPVAERARSAEAYSVLSNIASAQSAYYVEKDAYTTVWSQLDLFDSAPLSDNFTFSLNAANYGKAACKPGKGNTNYCMSYSGNKIACP